MSDSNMNCKNCENRKWKEHYIMAQARFDKYMTTAMVGLVITFTIMVVCLFVTVCMVIKTQRFIDQFEYVEETEIEIQQDCRGTNTVVFDSNEAEVVANGTELYRKGQEVLAEEKDNKSNTITISK